MQNNTFLSESIEEHSQVTPNHRDDFALGSKTKEVDSVIQYLEQTKRKRKTKNKKRKGLLTYTQMSVATRVTCSSS